MLEVGIVGLLLGVDLEIRQSTFAEIARAPGMVQGPLDEEQVVCQPGLLERVSRRCDGCFEASRNFKQLLVGDRSSVLSCDFLPVGFARKARDLIAQPGTINRMKVRMLS